MTRPDVPPSVRVSTLVCFVCDVQLIGRVRSPNLLATSYYDLYHSLLSPCTLVNLFWIVGIQ